MKTARKVATWVLAGVCVVVALAFLGGAASTHPATAGTHTSSSASPRAEVIPATTKVDWASVEVGDQVPLSAFDQPVAPLKAPAAKQERRLSKKSASYVSIPSMRAVAPIEVAAIVGGHMQIPDGGKVGWSNTSKRPGARHGVTVLAGHRDVRKGANAGPLYGAENLAQGSAIKVVWRGKPIRYKVTKITKHPRYALPPQLLDPNGPSRLAVITCTGPYELGRDGEYWLSRNAVIWAKKVA